jgi:hypothetical protein
MCALVFIFALLFSLLLMAAASAWDLDSSQSDHEHTSVAKKGGNSSAAWDIASSHSDDGLESPVVVKLADGLESPVVVKIEDDLESPPPKNRFTNMDSKRLYPSIAYWTLRVLNAASYARQEFPPESKPMTHEDFCCGTHGVRFGWQEFFCCYSH